MATRLIEQSDPEDWQSRFRLRELTTLLRSDHTALLLRDVSEQGAGPSPGFLVPLREDSAQRGQDALVLGPVGGLLGSDDIGERSHMHD
jgi:hypothetical protein